MNVPPREPQIRRVPMAPDARRSMTAAVLTRTTGSPCQRARVLIGSRPDEPLDAPTNALLSAHLDHCPACRELDAAVRDSRSVLAAWSEVEPTADFADGVIGATSRRHPWPQSAGGRPLSSLWEWSLAWRWRAADAWARLVERPRFSIELAYVATVLLMVLSGGPARMARVVDAGVQTIGAGSSGVVDWLDRQLSALDRGEPDSPPVRDGG